MLNRRDVRRLAATPATLHACIGWRAVRSEGKRQRREPGPDQGGRRRQKAALLQEPGSEPEDCRMHGGVG